MTIRTPFQPGARKLPPPPPRPPAGPHNERTIDALGLVVSTFTISVLLLLYVACVQWCYQQRRHGPSAIPARTPLDPVDRQPREVPAMPALVYPVKSPAAVAPSDGSVPEEAASCPICLGEYEEGEEVRVLPRCEHMYHRECIDPWLISSSAGCPVCRDPVIASVPAGEDRTVA